MLGRVGRVARAFLNWAWDPETDSLHPPRWFDRGCGPPPAQYGACSPCSPYRAANARTVLRLAGGQLAPEALRLAEAAAAASAACPDDSHSAWATFCDDPLMGAPRVLPGSPPAYSDLSDSDDSDDGENEGEDGQEGATAYRCISPMHARALITWGEWGTPQ